MKPSRFLDFFELKLVIHLGGSFNGGILEDHDGNPIFHFHVCWVEDLWEFASKRSGFIEIFPHSGTFPIFFTKWLLENAEQTLLIFVFVGF